MKTYMVLYLTLLAISMTQANVTYRQLLQLAKQADDSIKADHEIQLGELDDEVDLQSILKQMGHDLNFEERNDDEPASTVDKLDDVDNFRTACETDAHLDGNVKAGDCACYGKACVCCCALTFTNEGKGYYITLCARITRNGSFFVAELFGLGTKICEHNITRTGTFSCTVSSTFKVHIFVSHYSSTKICFYLYFQVNDTIYRCSSSSHCVVLPSSHIGSNLTKIDGKTIAHKKKDTFSKRTQNTKNTISHSRSKEQQMI